MTNKEAIFENVDQYSADELADFIKEGTVTFEELCDPQNTNGDFSNYLRTAVQSIINASEQNDWATAKISNDVETLEKYLSDYPEGVHRDEARDLISQIKKQEDLAAAEQVWENVNKDNVSDLEEFCEQNPNNPHIEDARERINELTDNTIDFSIPGIIKYIKEELSLDNDKVYNFLTKHLDKEISHDKLLSLIETDHNILHASTIKKLISDKKLTHNELEKKIRKEFIDLLRKNKATPQLKPTETTTLEKISRTSTEVYFWGIPSSGKTCALGTILNAAADGSVASYMEQDSNCQGYGYMTQLIQLFSEGENAIVLPSRTFISETYEMGFDLIDDKGTHPLTCIDLAGELFACMYKKIQKK